MKVYAYVCVGKKTKYTDESMIKNDEHIRYTTVLNVKRLLESIGDLVVLAV